MYFSRPDLAIALLTYFQDRSWNDPSIRGGFRTKPESGVDNRSTLKAVILDFSAVNNVDLTSVQVLVDVRKQLDRFASPDVVQWHFANVANRWTKRALVAAGFGTPAKTSEDGNALAKYRVFTVGEMDGTESPVSINTKSRIVGTSNWNIDPDNDVELAVIKNQEDDSDKIVTAGDVKNGKTTVTTREYASGPTRVAPIQGMNYPFFHVDLDSAIESAKAYSMGELSLSDESGLASD
jgi:sodium-independent sulfate anion transporter 11